LADDLRILADLIDIPMPEKVRTALIQLAERNALLRASLSEMRARNFELEKLADRDTLTPLPNRRRFVEELERVAEQVKRYGTSAVVLYVDVDNLKAINDRHGRYVGDAALVHLAKLLKGLIRSTDIAARVGGDEFALILDRVPEDGAGVVIDRIARRVAGNPLEAGGGEVPVEISIGSTPIRAGDTADDILQRGTRKASLKKAA
jgi:diguanylate cyclase (GGDEF)-like protein